MAENITALNKDEEEMLKDAMLNFVMRTLAPDRIKYPEEITILPDIINILFQHFIIYDLPNAV